MQIEDICQMIKRIEHEADWGPGRQISGAHVELFDDGSGKFIVEVSAIGEAPVDKLVGAIFTTDYKFDFDSVDEIEEAFQQVLNHSPKHPELE